MKTKLITILNHCIYNKTITDFNVIIELINNINDDKTDGISVNYNRGNIYISLWYDNKSLYSIMINDSNMVLFSLPDDISRTYVIENDSYNMQYSDIIALLIE